MYVVATAGHVDHGKSTLVRALTGIEPDRWDEEKRRGLTIDLGFAWTTTPAGSSVAFVDVPGHERFLGNMLAGIGPAPVVCFVVAADEGWRPQSDDHRDALAALGIQHGIVVVSRVDLAPGRVPEVREQVRRELAATGLRDAPVVPVSAVTGEGLQELLARLESVLAAAPRPRADARIRFWIDRAFSVRGAGTVVTGTLSAGTVRTGDRLVLSGARGAAEVVVRGIQTHGAPVHAVGPVERVALNLRSPGADAVHRGDVLVTPDAWHRARVMDVRRVSGEPLDETSAGVTAHLGTAAVRGHLRPFDAGSGRLSLEHDLPVSVGDRIILRGNGTQRIACGVQVLDVDPPVLHRRGDGRRRATVLAVAGAHGDADVELARRGAMRRTELQRLGVALPALPAPGIRVVGQWWLDEGTMDRWADALRETVTADRDRDPLSPGPSRGAVVHALGLPDPTLLDLVVQHAGAVLHGGTVRLDAAGGLGPAEGAVATLEARLRRAPFDAPEADDLTRLGLGRRELAAAERLGRVIRLGDGVVLLPSAPALAMRELSGLPDAFTTSAARIALGTTRRVVIPLLEHLDARGWTRRVDGTHRTVVRGGSAAER